MHLMLNCIIPEELRICQVFLPLVDMWNAPVFGRSVPTARRWPEGNATITQVGCSRSCWIHAQRFAIERCAKPKFCSHTAPSPACRRDKDATDTIAQTSQSGGKSGHHTRYCCIMHSSLGEMMHQCVRKIVVPCRVRCRTSWWQMLQII